MADASGLCNNVYIDTIFFGKEASYRRVLSIDLRCLPTHLHTTSIPKVFAIGSQDGGHNFASSVQNSFFWTVVLSKDFCKDGGSFGTAQDAGNLFSLSGRSPPVCKLERPVVEKIGKDSVTRRVWGGF